MLLVRLARTAAVIAAVAMWTSCGDTFRPIAIPITPPAPDPSPTHFVLFLSANGVSNAGANTQIDVSGDSNAGVANLGIGPVHAVLLPGGTDVYVANRLESTVSTYSLSDATKVSTIGLGTITVQNPVEQAKGIPVFVATTETAAPTNGSVQSVYVASQALRANGAIEPSAGTVSVITTSNHIVENQIPLAFSPRALAETPDAKKVYAVGGTAGVVSINTIDKSLNSPVVDASLNNPVWVVTSADSRRAFVLNGGGSSLTVLDTFMDAVVGSVSLGAAGANFMAYDTTRNRLYVTNPLASTLTVVDAAVDPSPSSVLATLPVVQGAGHVAVLPDTSRAYVVGFTLNGATLNSSVTVVNAQSNTVSKTIALDPATISTNPTGCGTTRFRLSIAAAADSSHVYVANCDAGTTSIIRTSDDTSTGATVPAPYSAFTPTGNPAVPPRQNPVFIMPVP